MRKRYIYITLALLIAFYLGARQSQGSIVDDTRIGVVAISDARQVLLDDGSIWVADESGWYENSNSSPIPISVSDVAFFGYNWLIAQNNDLWSCNAGEWANLGQPPGSTATEKSSWGEIKREFK